MNHSVVYYRISDGRVIGSTTSVNPPNIEVELPHYGSGVAALRVDFCVPQTGKIRTVRNGKMEYDDDMDYLAKKSKLEKDMREGIAQLKKLGLTDDQIKALMRV